MKMDNLQKVGQNLGQAVSKNSPLILTGLGVAGLITTSVMAVRVTPKALQILEEEQRRRDEAGEDVYLDKKEIIKLTWKCYVPAAIMGGLTVICIVGANSINTRRNAALASVYSLSKAALEEYQAKVVETIGANKERKIKDEIAKDRIAANPVTDHEVIITKKGDTLCFDNLSGRYFKSDIEEIKRACNKLSRYLITDMFVDLNQLYSELDLKGTKMGDIIGWHVDDGIIEPDFSSQLTDDGTPCLVLDFTVEPRVGHNGY